MYDMKTTDARSLSHSAQEALRQRVMRAIDGGMKQVEAVSVFGVSRAAIGKWKAAMRRGGGLRALKAKQKGRPPERSRLLGWQAALVVRTITDKTPDQLKMPFALWTREAVQAFVNKRFGITVSVWTVGRWLGRWGMTPQKPARRAWEQDPQAVRRWLEEEYPQVRREAKREGALIHWGDEMGLRSDHQAGTTYGRRGTTPVVPGTGQRWRCNMISALTNRGQLRFMVFKGRFDSRVFIDFMGRLIKTAGGQKIYLIVDSHPAHTSAAVKKWVRGREGQLRLIFLPPYSPQLNPDEFLNNDVKRNAVGQRRATSREDMIANVRGYLRSTQKHPDVVKRYFHAPTVQYAMAG
jgi:transposase